MNIQVEPTRSNLASAMLNSKIRPRAVVGYGVKIVLPSPPNYPLDKQRMTLLLLLDLSAAFDTVDYGTLLRRLKNSFGIQGKVFSWFQSYLSGRSQCISVLSAFSRRFNLDCGVPQGSCLGPLLFTLYTSRLFQIV